MKYTFFAIAILFSISVKAYNVTDTLRPESTPPIGVKTNKSQKAAPLRAKNITPKSYGGVLMAYNAIANITIPDNYDSTFNLIFTVWIKDTTNQQISILKQVTPLKGVALGSFPPTPAQQEAAASTKYGVTFLN
jgi:hypothetical protein